MEKIRLEPKIKELVEALWLRGIETFQSCEGHRKYREHHPWIIFNISYLEMVQKLVYEYNKKDEREIHWKADPYLSKSNCALLMPIEDNAPLEKQQQSAEDLAKEIKKPEKLPDTDTSPNAYC